ncbi:Fic family protein [Sulfurimonas sp. NWX79]|uniref:Fic family protein n=1 Tax=Sulfurimonas sp. NWX79 TaxID=2925412 RepID=UPI003204C8D4
MYEEKKWIWQHDDFPHFRYDRAKFLSLLSEISKKSGKLEGILESLGHYDNNFLEIESSTKEIVESSQIEGEVLNRDSVRSSILKRLDKLDDTKDCSAQQTDGLVELLLDSAQNHKPLTTKRLFGWHNTLFPSGYSGLYKIEVAQYRLEEISVVSQKNGKEKIHYTAPPPQNVSKAMEELLEYVNNAKEDPYIKAAVAHLWFLTIHPFDDGNGRIARTLTNYILAKELSQEHFYFSISTAIANDKKNYYKLLEKAQRILTNSELNIESWIEWHSKMILSAIEQSLSQIQKVVEKTAFWDRAREHSLNTRQIKVLNKLLDFGKNDFEGGLNVKKYISITKTSPATAKRDISDLVKKGFLKKVEGSAGRNTRYNIVV